MAPVTVRDAKGRETVVTEDEGPAPRLRPRRRWPGSGRLRPAEARTAARRPTARSRPATRPGITDGAAATVVASERAVERLGLTPLARIVGYAQAEVAPKWLFLAPVEGVKRLLERIELPIEAFDLIEINEAFAAQTLADGASPRVRLGQGQRQWRGDRARATRSAPVARGSWPRCSTSWRRREGRYGLATLCLGGGGSVAMAVERVLTPRAIVALVTGGPTSWSLGRACRLAPPARGGLPGSSRSPSRRSSRRSGPGLAPRGRQPPGHG